MFAKFRKPTSFPIALAALILSSPTSAQAHVKWFCAFSVAGQPNGLSNVLCQDFELLSVIAIAALVFGALVDRSFIGEALNRSLDRVFGLIAVQPDVLVRAGVGLMMVAAWTLGGVILTPELATTSTAIPWLQLAIAACLIDRRTLPVASLGIVTLFSIALANYGLFHLADYPIFLGVAAYLAAVGLNRTIFGARPLDVLRWSLAVTLMWASVEKWAYPGWTYPLFVIGVLCAMVLDDAKARPSLRRIATLPIGFGTALAAFIGVYYVAHAALYGTTVF